MKASVQALINGFKEAATQAIEQMIDEMGVGNILDKLYTLPDAIKGQELVLLKARQNLEGIHEEMNLLKQVVMAQVTDEIGDNGKARYSNETARSAETTVRLAVNEAYQAYKSEYQKAETAAHSAQFELTKLNNDLGTYKVVGQILAAKMNLLAGL